MANTSCNYEECLQNYLKNTQKLALLLDYDGTLTPIVAHPDLAKIPPETKNILRRLSENPNIFVAIISGRSSANVKEIVGLPNIVYAGNHGLEVIYPDGSVYKHQLPTDFDDRVKDLVATLEKKLVKDGAWIENKGASLTFHFRAVPEHLQDAVGNEAKRIIEESNFKPGGAHCAIEARPKVDWNKGSVALLLLNNKYGDSWNNNVKVIFAGDDTTDEDAMKALKGHAVTFRISPKIDIDTAADVRINSTEDVVKILQVIEELYK